MSVGIKFRLDNSTIVQNGVSKIKALTMGASMTRTLMTYTFSIGLVGTDPYSLKKLSSKGTRVSDSVTTLAWRPL